MQRRKAELILKMQKADPSGAQMQEAAQYHLEEDNLEEGSQEEGTAQTRENIRLVGEDRLHQQEVELLIKENSLMQKEIDLLR